MKIIILLSVFFILLQEVWKHLFCKFQILQFWILSEKRSTCVYNVYEINVCCLLQNVNIFYFFTVTDDNAEIKMSRFSGGFLGFWVGELKNNNCFVAE